LDYHLLYTQKALNDLAEILAHIAEDDAGAASRLGTSVLGHIDLLVAFPRLGMIASPILIYSRQTKTSMPLRFCTSDMAQENLRGRRLDQNAVRFAMSPRNCG